MAFVDDESDELDDDEDETGSISSPL